MSAIDGSANGVSSWCWVNRPLALAVLAFCAWSAWTFPVAQMALTVGLVAYLLILWRWPYAWLIVLPAALPVLELGFWSGRFFFNTYDLLVLSTISWGLWRSRPWVRYMGAGVILFALLLLVGQTLITLNGLLPLHVPVPGAWEDYFASTNALREYKGILWALLLWPILAGSRGEGGDIQRWFTAGILVGLVMAFVTIVWERGLFTGLFNFSDPYRISGWFFSILTGGAPIDAFLALSAPFVLALLLLWRRSWLIPVGLGLAVAALYALYVTYSRANYPALLVMAGVFVLGLVLNLRRDPSRWRHGGSRLVLAGAILAAVGIMAIAIVAGQQIQSRFVSSQSDLMDRLKHWESIVKLVHEYPGAQWIGLGKGSFPRDYYLASQLAGRHLATAQLHREPVQNFVRFSKSDGHGALFLRQRFTKTDEDSYRVELQLRTPEGKPEALLIEFCERHILKFRAECRWTKARVTANDGQWQQVSATVSLRGLAEKKFGPFARPLDISLMNRGIRQGLDIGSVQLLDSAGKALLDNSDFSRGWERWFLSYGNHKRWNVDNVFVYWYYEGGWIGLALMILLAAYVALRLFRACIVGDYFALLTVTALTGAIMVGLFNSLFDDPRISLLFYLLVGVGLIGRPMAPLPLPAMPVWLNRRRLLLFGRLAMLGLGLLLVLRFIMPNLFQPFEVRLEAWMVEQRSPILTKWLVRNYAADVDAELKKALPPWKPLSDDVLAPGEIRVGNRTFKRFSEAVAALRPGDHLRIGPGRYRQPLVIGTDDVQISGVGHVIIERTQAQGKAAIITQGDNIRLSNIECRHIAVPDRNGACVRHEGTNLTLNHVYFHDSETGVLTGSNPGLVHVIDSRFERLARAHGIYMGRGGELVIEGSYFLASKSGGHEIKSRAPKTRLVRTVVASLGSNDSRLIDLPNGGLLQIENSVLEQGPASYNKDAIGFGLEGNLHSEQGIELVGNIVILERKGDNRLFRLANGTLEPRLERNVLINVDTWGDAETNLHVDSREQTDIGPYPQLPPAPRD